MDESDLQRRFGGIERLYGTGSLARLTSSHVCVIGIGGVGSWAAEALARSGIGRLTLIDLDHVAESNVNRQAQAITGTLGQAKVLAMRDRIAAIHPDCAVDCVEEFITPENVASLIHACDAVVDAIDQVRAKAALIAHCRHAKIPLVTTGGAGGRTDPARMRIDDLSRTTQDALASKVRALLRKEYGFPREKKFGVECVYSVEPAARPSACDVDESGLHGLSCAGYGSSVCVTAAFGFAAASRALGILAA
ncbi:MAG: tRNA threonylcarbamoyladenosine dehydratase [Candidatus Nitricoxidivorans perseverans]|uniref:tRNA threonylcarbamoyladenosine dehydratase n=1 Tax=Candidatus Nitricoxidivorans perseverans TaxID=2975601 RepID=A0AA49FJW1_9PROT|nr:MAG: tRNA threonylcarbamoyladenosine dehydratase [Candidatus Nitricoxidivorans perseverans]